MPSASGGKARVSAAARLVLAAGMPPSEVADKLVTKIRSGTGLYLLTDHEWDPQIIARHEAILAGAVGPVIPGGAQ